MRIILQSPGGAVSAALRRAGYKPLRIHGAESESYIRTLRRADYPRFHIYVYKKKSTLAINLHYDEKRPSYKGTRAHTAQYQGELVAGEAARVLQILEGFGYRRA